MLRILGGSRDMLSQGIFVVENLGLNLFNFGVILMPLNIDYSIIQLRDQLNLSISQGFRYKPGEGAIANPGGCALLPPRLTPVVY